MANASRILKLVKLWSGRSENIYDVALRPNFHGWSQASSFVRLTTVCSAAVRRNLLLPLLNLYHIIYTVAVLQAVTQLEVSFLIFRVLRHVHLSTYPFCLDC
ncbi:unnamed protein product [Laminaria digitata]